MPKLLTYAAVGFGSLVLYKSYGRFVEGRRRLGDDTHVVIVGGGYAGTTLASCIKGKGKFTLIDPKDSLHHNMASLRAAVLPRFAEKTFIKYVPTFGDNFLQGRVVAVDPKNKQITLDGDDKTIPYTRLVFATGSRGYFPGKCDDHKSTSALKEQYDNYARAVSKSKKIVVVGGGAVGVEMAGEIADFYPDIEVTVIHSGSQIIGKDLLPKAETKLLDTIKEMNINLILNEKVSNMDSIPLNSLEDEIIVKTASGQELSANMVIPCIGLKVNSEAYASSLGNAVNGLGQLKVDSTLKVEGYEDIYAIGDCNDYKILKLALVSEQQAKYMWDTLLRLDEKKDIEPYKPDTMRMVIPMGKERGVAQNGNMVLGDRGARFIKGKDVFVKMAWGNMKQPVPKDS